MLPHNVPLFRPEAVRHKAGDLMGGVLFDDINHGGIVACGVMGLALLVGAACFFGHYTQRTQATGWVSIEPNAANVIARSSGVVKSVSVKNGDWVDAGQLLVEISRDRATAQDASIDKRVMAHLQDERALLQEQMGIAKRLSERAADQLRVDIEASKRAVQGAIHLNALARQRTELTRNDEQRAKQAADLGFVSRKGYEDIQAAQLGASIAERESAQRIEAENAKLQQRLGDLERAPIEEARTMSELKSRLEALDQSVVEAESASDSAIYASVSGQVSLLNIFEGQSITAGERISTLIPRGALYKAELLVPSSSAGFLSQGMEVWLRYDSFPYQRFGQYRGVVSTIDRTVLAPSEQTGPVKLSEAAYRVSVNLDRQTVSAYGAPFSLKPGLTLHASISERKVRLIDLVIDPLRAAAQAAY